MKKLDKDICIVGLGFVGLTLAIKMAEKNFNVIGIEKNKEILRCLKKKKSHFFEPNINNRISKIIKNNKFKFFNKIPKKSRFSVYIITAGTPVNKNKRFESKDIKKISLIISKFIKNGDLVILRSTVRVGTTRQIVLPILKKSKKSFDLAYCPERTQEGNALNELKILPQIIGGINNLSKQRSKKIFEKITKNILFTSKLETAELIKILDNTYRDVSFAFANEVSLICNSLNINSREVINLGKFKYPRTNIPNPGPVGGPCLAKDTYILKESLKKNKFLPLISMSARSVNENLLYKVYEYLDKNFFINKKNIRLKISLLGFAFKGDPETSDLRGSISIDFFKILRDKIKKNIKIYGYDPLVKKEDLKDYKFFLVKDIKEAFVNANLVIILNNNKKFKNLNIKYYTSLMAKNSMIYDFWNLFSLNYIKKNLSDKTIYKSLGNH
jgi:UDP-N-acetyl-D-mannosaminuronic acid dehydrogenase